MRKAVLVFGFLAGVSGVTGQCPDDNVLAATVNTFLSQGSGGPTNIRAGRYVALTNVSVGKTYTINVQNANWSACLTLYSSTGTPLAYDPDKILTWTATVSGTVKVLLDQAPCLSNNALLATVNVSWYSGLPVAEDCIGARVICGSEYFTSNTTNTGNVADLNTYSYGCLASSERQGTWYAFAASSPGSIAFTITPSAPNTDYDFAVWGPYPPGTTKASICTPSGSPLRCSYSSLFDATGLNYSATDNSEDAFGDRWTSYIPAATGSVYLLYISNWSMNGLAFTLTWQLTNGASLDCGVVLPVELLSFDGHHQEQGNVLEWSTATEQNNDHYTISRSANAIDWTPITTVPGAGTTQSATSYAHVDRDYPQGINYYRLEQTDLDGLHQNLKTISIDNSKETVNVLRRVNFMGQQVDEHYRGYFIEHRERGESIIRYQ